MKAIGRFVLFLFFAVAIIGLAVFAINNRAVVTVDLWPLPWRPRWPLYGLVLGTGAAGLVLGACLCGLSKIRLWWRARTSERRAARLAAEAARRKTVTESAFSAPAVPARRRAAMDDA